MKTVDARLLNRSFGFFSFKYFSFYWFNKSLITFSPFPHVHDQFVDQMTIYYIKNVGLIVCIVRVKKKCLCPKIILWKLNFLSNLQSNFGVSNKTKELENFKSLRHPWPYTEHHHMRIKHEYFPNSYFKSHFLSVPIMI